MGDTECGEYWEALWLREGRRDWEDSEWLWRRRARDRVREPESLRERWRSKLRAGARGERDLEEEGEREVRRRFASGYETSLSISALELVRETSLASCNGCRRTFCSES